MDSNKSQNLVTSQSDGNHQPHLMWLGVAPSQPRPLRRSNKERAKAWAALQASMHLHLLNQANWAPTLKTGGSWRTFALARCSKKCAVSCDHRPPTSAARTTKRVLPCLPGELGVAVLLPPTGGFQDGTIDISAPKTRGPISAQCRDQSCVHCQLSSMKRRQAVNQDLGAAFIELVRQSDVHVLDPGVRRRSRAHDTHELQPTPLRTRDFPGPPPQHMRHGGGH